MTEIEKKLHDIHAAARQNPNPPVVSRPSIKREELPIGFAKVNAVTQGSPAALAVSYVIENGMWLGTNTS